MREFIAKHEEEVAGVLSGFDRLVFRGTLRSISYPKGMMNYLWAQQVRLTEFGQHVQRVSERLKQAWREKAERLGRPVQYLSSAGGSKEQVARAMQEREKIEEGMVCALSCVEPCQSFEVYGNRETRKLELVTRMRKCLFLYSYWMHREFGFLSARIQSWFPFSIQVCLNGREWLARQMEGAGVKYVRRENCFPWVQDWKRAQELLRQQVQTNWPRWLGEIAGELNPGKAWMFRNFPVSYYWTLGKPVRGDGEIPKSFRGEVVSDLKWREE